MQPQRIVFLIIVVALFFLLVCGAYFCIWQLRMWGVPIPSRLFGILTIVGIVLPFVMMGTMAVGSTLWHPLNAALYAVSSSWLALVNFFFFTVIAVAIIRILMIVIGITLPDLVYGITATVVGFGLFIGATVNALYPRVKHYAIESSALATELSGKKIALVSDLHIGMVRKKAFVERVSKLIMSEQPDMILIAGDLIDGPRFPYDKFLAPLAQLAAPLGVYFTPGNHEHYNNQNDLFYQAVPSNVTVLIDQKIQLTDHAVDIIGIDYRAETFTETKSHLVAAGHEPERPTIVLLHDPKNTPALAESGVSLSVSGHTHGGQFFPGTLLIKFLYGKYAQGLALTNGMPSVTTVGAGGAVAPVRLGTRPEVAILTIVDTLQ